MKIKKEAHSLSQEINRLRREMKNILRKTSVSIPVTMRTTAIRSRMKQIKKCQAILNQENQGAQ